MRIAEHAAEGGADGDVLRREARTRRTEPVACFVEARVVSEWCRDPCRSEGSCYTAGKVLVVSGQPDVLAGRYRIAAPLPPIGGVPRDLAVDTVTDAQVEVARFARAGTRPGRVRRAGVPVPGGAASLPRADPRVDGARRRPRARRDRRRAAHRGRAPRRRRHRFPAGRRCWSAPTSPTRIAALHAVAPAARRHRQRGGRARQRRPRHPRRRRREDAAGRGAGRRRHRRDADRRPPPARPPALRAGLRPRAGHARRRRPSSSCPTSSRP